MSDYDMSIHGSPDARVWARAFVESYNRLQFAAPDEEMMVGWFANAMMAMHDHLKRAPASPEAPAPDAVTALVEAYGEAVGALHSWGGAPRQARASAAKAALISAISCAGKQEAEAPDVEAARLAYANACEQMGIAHANGSRAEWEEAEREENRTRRVLMAAISRAVSEAREAAIDEAAKVGYRTAPDVESGIRVASAIRALASTTRGDAR